MNDLVKTVMVQTKNGPVVINECDFDKKKHKLAKAVEPPVEPPVEMVVTKKNNKHFVVDKKGVLIEHEKIDAKGYGAEKDAWDAILAVNQV